MIPLRDTNPSRNYPVVNIGLIAVNVLVYFLEMSQGGNIDRFVFTYGLVPARYTVPEISSYFTPFQQGLSFLSFMFVHGGFWHLLGNMWSLYIFGDNVEDRLGPVRYLLFYLLCGLASGLSHMLLNLNSNIPTIGASGAIAGVMGAYVILYPHAKILTLIPIIIIPWFVEIPAYFFLGIWLFMQVISAAGSAGGAAGIAWWAHIGGFIFGMLLIKLVTMIPTLGISARVRQATVKKNTPTLQVVHPERVRADANLAGTITINPYEATFGTRKLVNVPLGLHKRLFRVTVPAGVTEGQKLRLAGQGKRLADGTQGDLYLKVHIAVRPSAGTA